MMGSPNAEAGREADEGPLHEVILDPFLLGQYPVTNADYTLFLQSNPGCPEPAIWQNKRYCHRSQPVEVTWNEADQFARWAGARLPTEAEWEYACRAGSTSASYGPLAEIAWYSSASSWGRMLEHLIGASRDVGCKQPNAFDLHDMLGNVNEWCSDWYGPYSPQAAQNPTGPSTGEKHVSRGGAWHNPPSHMRAAYRLAVIDDLVSGIRLALNG